MHHWNAERKQRINLSVHFYFFLIFKSIFLQNSIWLAWKSLRKLQARLPIFNKETIVNGVKMRKMYIVWAKYNSQHSFHSSFLKNWNLAESQSNEQIQSEIKEFIWVYVYSKQVFGDLFPEFLILFAVLCMKKLLTLKLIYLESFYWHPEIFISEMRKAEAHEHI